jgi:hypothetical protein
MFILFSFKLFLSSQTEFLHVWKTYYEYKMFNLQVFDSNEIICALRCVFYSQFIGSFKLNQH